MKESLKLYYYCTII